MKEGECQNCCGCGNCSKKQKIKVEQHTFPGALWFIGWLFTIGFLHLSFGKGVLAIIIWPYYLGVHFAA